MYWFLIHTKPRQEVCALENLERQGYECYLPLLRVEKLRRRQVVVTEEALFPRYLFIRLGEESTGKSWHPIRSTRGVSQLVRFGSEPARVADELIDLIREKESATDTEAPRALYQPGDRLTITSGAFAGVDGIYQTMDGEQRVIMLIELMQKTTQIRVAPGDLHKTAL
ncbi:MAG: transcription/translation regulatory transformer protein RfaH [Zoogloeaceae bacterium]|jgi:transcriptional antiterminator RfaH|nr:transcription/translation regulatory transformer protein RfaH [Zoogloeaceae bacterium]